jgi:hypothetical protein
VLSALSLTEASENQILLKEGRFDSSLIRVYNSGIFNEYKAFVRVKECNVFEVATVDLATVFIKYFNIFEGFSKGELSKVKGNGSSKVFKLKKVSLGLSLSLLL